MCAVWPRTSWHFTWTGCSRTIRSWAPTSWEKSAASPTLSSTCRRFCSNAWVPTSELPASSRCLLGRVWDVLAPVTFSHGKGHSLPHSPWGELSGVSSSGHSLPRTSSLPIPYQIHFLEDSPPGVTTYVKVSLRWPQAWPVRGAFQAYSRHTPTVFVSGPLGFS